MPPPAPKKKVTTPAASALSNTTAIAPTEELNTFLPTANQYSTGPQSQILVQPGVDSGFVAGSAKPDLSNEVFGNQRSSVNTFGAGTSKIEQSDFSTVRQDSFPETVQPSFAMGAPMSNLRTESNNPTFPTTFATQPTLGAEQAEPSFEQKQASFNQPSASQPSAFGSSPPTFSSNQPSGFGSNQPPYQPTKPSVFGGVAQPGMIGKSKDRRSGAGNDSDDSTDDMGLSKDVQRAKAAQLQAERQNQAEVGRQQFELERQNAEVQRQRQFEMERQQKETEMESYKRDLIENQRKAELQQIASVQQPTSQQRGFGPTDFRQQQESIQPSYLEQPQASQFQTNSPMHPPSLSQQVDPYKRAAPETGYCAALDSVRIQISPEQYRGQDQENYQQSKPFIQEAYHHSVQPVQEEFQGQASVQEQYQGQARGFSGVHSSAFMPQETPNTYISESANAMTGYRSSSLHDPARIARDQQEKLNHHINEIKTMNAQILKQGKASEKSTASRVCFITLILILVLLILFFAVVIGLFIYVNFIKH